MQYDTIIVIVIVIIILIDIYHKIAMISIEIDDDDDCHANIKFYLHTYCLNYPSLHRCLQKKIKCFIAYLIVHLFI